MLSVEIKENDKTVGLLTAMEKAFKTGSKGYFGMGKIQIGLHQDKTPRTVKNFLGYVRIGHYDGTVFHRVIPGFMAQGGGFLPDISQEACHRMLQCTPKPCMRAQVRTSMDDLALSGGRRRSAGADFSRPPCMSQVRQIRQSRTKT